MDGFGETTQPNAHCTCVGGWHRLHVVLDGFVDSEEEDPDRRLTFLRLAARLNSAGLVVARASARSHRARARSSYSSRLLVSAAVFPAPSSQTTDLSAAVFPAAEAPSSQTTDLSAAVFPAAEAPSSQTTDLSAAVFPAAEAPSVACSFYSILW